MAITSVESVPITDKIEASPPKARLRPRRTLNRLALGLAGLTVAALGQLFFSLESLGDGLLCYGLAVILFTWALAGRLYPHHSPLPPGQPAMQLSRWPGIWRFNFGVWLILLAVTISFFAFNFLPNDDARRLVWWLYLASLLVLISGGLLLARDRSWQAELRHLLPNRAIALGLLTVLGLAVVLRLYQLDQLPFGIWFDEAEAGLEARRMLAEPTYRPVFHMPINITGHLLAVYAMALAWLGDSIVSMRLVSVLFGLGGVLAAYLFGRELRGPRFGLILAFLVAVARWHLNFSRIAMTGIDTPFFEFLSLFFLIRLLRRGRLRDALWAGLGLGFGLVFYTAFRLFVLALLIFAVLAGLVWVIQRVRTRAAWATGGKATSPDQAGVRPSSAQPPSWLERWLIFLPQHGTGWSLLGQVTVLLVSTWLVTMPIAKFALDNPAAFRFRTDQVSILARRDQPDLGRALWSNTAKHLLMFNYKGDGNGRHNLPGTPMLDPAMAILAVLGLGLVLARPHYPGNAFFLLLFVLALMGGIFSVDFEAPQSLRSIAVLP
ncbi:MAG TPA: glycosyltransferase family 39 protein, partial [Anaerolineae bacterium]